MTKAEAEQHANQYRMLLRRQSVQLKEFRDSNAHIAMGYSSFEAFAAKELGLSAQEITEMLTIAERCTR